MKTPNGTQEEAMMREYKAADIQERAVVDHEVARTRDEAVAEEQEVVESIVEIQEVINVQLETEKGGNGEKNKQEGKRKQYQKQDSYLTSSKKLVLDNKDLALSTKENETQLDTALIKQRINELNIICNITKSAISNAKVFTYDYVRLLSTRKYLQHLLDGKKK